MDRLGLYLHIPFCQTKCFYCDFAVVVGRGRRQSDYVAALCAEIVAWGAVWPAELSTIYFGGGTPSLLSPDQVATVLAACRAAFSLAPDAEISLEANPGTLDRPRLTALRQAGVNRLSLGVQVFDDRQLRNLGRLHTAADARAAVGDARSAGFDNLSLDLMYGLPDQDLTSWNRTLSEAVALAPEHLSTYGLTIEPATQFGRRQRTGELTPVDPDEAADCYEAADALLGAAGYRRYEIANFARPGHECHHNLIYWRNQPFLGLGMGAHSSSVIARFGDHRHLNEYLGGLAGWDGPHFDAPGVPRPGGPIEWVESLDEATQLAETMILGLRLAEGVELDGIARRFGARAEDRWQSEIAELAGLGLLQCEDGRLRLTDRGRLLGDEVFARFLLER
ncbi:MAG: radical SAM family heme chaperone HemW [Dehalococcoidia bacterium]